MSKKISIIIPVYNAEMYLEDCINSILQQSYANFEIILVNDGSTDGTQKICNNYSTKDARINLISQKNCGVAASRNKGILSCNTESNYVMFVDADDKLLPNALECLVVAMEDQNADMTIGGLVHGDEYGYIKEQCDKSKSLYLWDEFLKAAIEDHPFTYYCVRILYKKSFIEGISFEEGRITGEDSMFIFNCALKNPKVTIINEDVYFYRSNPQSVTQSKFSRKKYEDICYFLHKKINIIEQKYPHLANKAYNLIVKTNMMLLKIFVLSNEKEWHEERRKAIKDFVKYKNYFVAATQQNHKWFQILSSHLYYPYKILLKLKLFFVRSNK